MQVSDELVQRVKTRVQQLHNILRPLFLEERGCDMPPITITFHRKGRAAGFAYFNTYRIDINPILLQAHPERIIHQTVGHEFAHLATNFLFYKKYGTAAYGHGDLWKSVMRLLGLQPDRVHHLDTSMIPKRVISKYTYYCGCDGDDKIHKVSGRANKVIKEGTKWYTCKRCGVRLVPAPPVINQSNKLPDYLEDQSKMDKARWLYTHNKDLSRVDVCKIFVMYAGLTPAGASTYYNKLSK